MTSPAGLIRPSDVCFADSPDTGDPRCRCSRCGEGIGEHEVALRVWPQDVRHEYRYCKACQQRMGFGASGPGP